MFKKVLSFTLIIFVVNLVCAASVNAAMNTEKEARLAEKVRAGILKLGTGTEARVEVKLRDKSKVKGYISEANNENFVIVDEKSNASKTIPYPQVKQAKGNNLSTGVKIAIGIAIGVAVLFIVIRLALRGS